MNIPLATTLLLLSAASSAVLGGVVFFRNPRKRTHQRFAVLALDLMLWALGVACIIHAETEASTLFWLRATFIVASFLPATFYHFITCFPNQRFEGFRSVAALLYIGALAESVGCFTPWYVTSITIEPGTAPLVTYGPVFLGYPVWIALSMLFMFANLVRKVRHATGIERRQIEHVLIGIFLTTTLATATNVLAPVLNIGSLEPYGPIFTVLMMGAIAYAMIRYNLLDIWAIVSRTTIYAIVTVFVIGTFLGTVSLVHWVFSNGGRTASFITTLLAALVIALVLQPIKERIQLFVERTVLKRHYDINQLCSRITRTAARTVHLDHLLDTVIRDIRETLGVGVARVLLLDEKDPDVLITEYTSVLDEQKTATREHQALIKYVRANSDPLVLKKLLHDHCTDETMLLARHLAELDAYACIPLRASSGVVGLLTLGEKNSGDMYSKDDGVVFATVAGPLGTAIENARLYRKLEEVNLHLARILANMPGGVIVVDAQGTITAINASARDMIGDVKIGQPLEVLPEEIGSVLRQTLADARGIGDFETVIVSLTHENIPVAISSSCLESAGGKTCGALAMIHNQTQVKRLEQNVKRADRLSSIGTLAAGMAHEVKNPLVSIKTFTQLLPARFDDPDFRKTFAEVVPHEVERIDMIVSRVLDFARPKPVKFAPQNLTSVLHNVLALVENQARKCGVTACVEFCDEDIPVYGDEQQLHQVFLNLCLNAIDALRGKTGGTLSLRAHYDRAHLRRNGVASFLETDCVRVVVADTGCGISPEHIELLFTPFFTTKAEGCGLGLSVVHGIVMEHGGEIDVSSTPGIGTSFTVLLPIVRDGVKV